MRSSMVRALVVLSVTSLLAGAGAVAGPATAAPPDQVVTFTNLHDGARVSADGAPIATQASQGPGVASSWLYARYYIDGVLFGPAVNCSSGSPLTCATSTYWSTVGLTGTHTLQVSYAFEEFGVPAGEVASPVITVTVSPERPAVAITSPTQGQVVAGLIQVDVAASIPADLVDTATRVRLYNNAERTGPPIGTVECAGQPDDHQCQASFAWDTSDMISPTWYLRATFDTSHGGAWSEPVAANVQNPDVTASMISPAPGPVTGIVDVSATATIPAPRTNTADEFALYVSDAFIGRQSCAGQPSDHVCTATIPWDTRGLPPGTYSVLMVFQYQGPLGGSRVAPAPVQVTVPAAGRLSLAVRPAASGTTARGSGRFTTVSGGQPIAGAPLTVTIRPAAGAVRTIKVTTDALGAFRWSWPATTNATIDVVAAGSGTWAPATATARAGVSAPLRCTWTRAVPRGRVAVGRCAVAGLPAGSRYTLQTRVGSTWRTSVRGLSAKGQVRFARAMTTRGTVLLRVQLPANRLWSATTGPTMKIAVT